jgi:hypothetical protein
MAGAINLRRKVVPIRQVFPPLRQSRAYYWVTAVRRLSIYRIYLRRFQAPERNRGCH